MNNELRLLFRQPVYAVGSNGRLVWQAKARLVRELRSRAKLVTLAVVRNYPDDFDGFEPEVYDIVWYYSRGVEPDEDGVLSRCKALLDGCADALGVNDRGWHIGEINRVKVPVASPLSGQVEITLRRKESGV